MALIGYVRVSSLDQDTTTQLERVTAANCKKVFAEKESGTGTKEHTDLADTKRPEQRPAILVFRLIL